MYHHLPFKTYPKGQEFLEAVSYIKYNFAAAIGSAKSRRLSGAAKPDLYWGIAELVQRLTVNQE